MSIASLPKMVVSSREGWPDLERIHPSVIKVFAFLVLPLSMLPPIMLYYAGSHYGAAFGAGFESKPWGTIAGVFFLAELATFGGMGWFIRQFAQTHQVAVSQHDAYLLAGITPVPLWLSSLGLLFPSLPFNFGLAFVALILSCGLIYHGVSALCHTHEEVAAMAITHGVIGAGLVAWAFLLLLVLAL